MKLIAKCTYCGQGQSLCYTEQLLKHGSWIPLIFLVVIMTLITEISKIFSKQAAEYEQAATVQAEIGQRLFDRLQYLKIAPKYILDLGCGPGSFSKQLAKRYPKAHIIGLDIAQAMLQQAKSKQSFRKKWSLTRANMQHLPFASGLFDLVFSNQALHWAYPLDTTFRELNRVMNVNGCFMFSTLGPDTFKEIKHAWAKVNAYAHTNEFMDMHDVGDVLMQEQFLDPVVDMEQLAVHYSSLSELIDSLKNQGVKNIHQRRNPGLTGKNNWQQFVSNFESLTTQTGKYPLSYEVVYGHAWKGANSKTSTGTETMIPISKIVRS